MTSDSGGPLFDSPDVRELAYRRITELINSAADFQLVATNTDRPNADKYGTHPDGSPRYAPEWYAVQSVKTGFINGLYGALNDCLRCLSLNADDRWCIGALGHEGWHHDGDGASW
jgi:hypothetical protein